MRHVIVSRDADRFNKSKRFLVILLHALLDDANQLIPGHFVTSILSGGFWKPPFFIHCQLILDNIVWFLWRSLWILKIFKSPLYGLVAFMMVIVHNVGYYVILSLVVSAKKVKKFRGPAVLPIDPWIDNDKLWYVLITDWYHKFQGQTQSYVSMAIIIGPNDLR